ncbi:MAG: F0F1 ATP synthase subunit A [Catenulispora sp.]|nr:F0F1 ATP synthase subunit A [Catenulispora sp.]
MVSLQLAPVADVPWPPSVDEFFPPGVGGSVWITKFTIMVWIAVALIILFFVLTQRNAKIVPTKAQWIGESVYGFVRNGIAKEVIGHEGPRFAPYLTTLFVFISFVNIFAIIPGFQISPSSHIAFPIILALLSYVIYWYQGAKKHGFWNYIKTSIVLPAPWWVQPILLPIELGQILIIRPVTLAVRLFANLFAGHLILLVFTLGGFVLLGTGNIGLAAVGVVSWGMALVMTLFEAGVALLQAYVFVLLTASYVQSSLADEH